jgi:hypothetical protein
MPDANDVARVWAWPIDEEGEAIGDGRPIDLGTTGDTVWARAVSDPVEDDLVDATRFGIGQILSPAQFTYHVDPAGEAGGWLGTITRALTQTVRDTTGDQDLEVVVDFAPLLAPLRHMGEIVDGISDLVRRVEEGDSDVGRQLREAGDRARQARATLDDAAHQALDRPSGEVLDHEAPPPRTGGELIEDMRAWMETFRERAGEPVTAYVMGEEVQAHLEAGEMHVDLVTPRGFRRLLEQRFMPDSGHWSTTEHWGPGAPIGEVTEITEDQDGVHYTGEALVASGGICAPLSPYWDFPPMGHPSQIPVDQLAYDRHPDGCWATAMGEEDNADADACNLPAVDELGLCAKHRARMTDGA